VNLIYALTAIHNFIAREAGEVELNNVSGGAYSTGSQQGSESVATTEPLGCPTMNRLRDEMAARMWRDYQMYLN
jgi:hypothetical protein